MQGEKEKVRDTIEGSGRQQPVGQDSIDSEYGEIGESQGGSGKQPNIEGEGFILQKDESPAKATESTDFAAERRGGPEEEDEASSEGGAG